LVVHEQQRLLGEGDRVVRLDRHRPGQRLGKGTAKLGAGRAGGTLGFPLLELGQGAPDLDHVRGREGAESGIKNRPAEHEGNRGYRALGFRLFLRRGFFALVGNRCGVVEMHHRHLDGVGGLKAVVALVPAHILVAGHQFPAARHDVKVGLAAQFQRCLGTQNRTAQEQKPQRQIGFLRHHARVSQPNPCQM